MDLSITDTAAGVDVCEESRTVDPRRITEADLVSGAGTSVRNGPAADVSITHRAGGVEVHDELCPAISPLTGPFPPKSCFLVSHDLKALADVDSSLAPLVLRSTRAPPVVDQDGFTLVRSRKYGMLRGRFPDQPVPVLNTPCDCDVEVPWGAWFGGCVCLIRKHYQARRSGMAVTSEGPGYFVYGSFGPDGHEV